MNIFCGSIFNEKKLGGVGMWCLEISMRQGQKTNRAESDGVGHHDCACLVHPGDWRCCDPASPVRKPSPER